MLADAEDRHDVRVMQPRGRAGLALEPADLLRVGERPRRQDLEGDATAERLLLGLVHDAHAAAPHLAQQAELAQAAGVRPDVRIGLTADRRRAVGGLVAELLHHQECREQREDLLGQLGMLLGVVLGRHRLAATDPLEELLGQDLDGVPIRSACRHGRPFPFCEAPEAARNVVRSRAHFEALRWKPGSEAMITLIRFRGERTPRWPGRARSRARSRSRRWRAARNAGVSGLRDRAGPWH